jgi:hypothetical protein
LVEILVHYRRTLVRIWRTLLVLDRE